MGLNDETRTVIVGYFKRKPEVSAVYLYGSQATNQAKKDSDIDLAVLVADKNKYTGFNLPQIVFTQELSRLTGREVEVQDLNMVSVDFAHRVLAQGKLLLSNNEKERIEFEEEILRTYFDLKPALEEYYQQLSQITKKGELHVRYS